MAMLLLYIPLIKREERFLEDIFGKEHKRYKEKVPALYPNFSLYKAPKSMEIAPEFLLNALKDGVWWILTLPLIEFIQYMQSSEWLPVLFSMP